MSDQPPAEFDSTPISLDELLAALLDEQTPFSPRYLYRLSGLEGAEFDQFKAAWPEVSTNRRRALLEDLEPLAEANFALQFDPISQIALADEEAEIRALAIRLLWGSEDPALIPTFLSILNHDASPETRAQAASALGQFVYLGEMDELPESSSKEVEDNLFAAYRGKNPKLVRRRALEALGYSSSETVPDLLEEAFASNDDEWLASALFAAGRSADERWEPRISDALDHTNAEVRMEAARAAGELESEESVPALLNLLDDEDADVRMASAWSLSQIGGPGVRDALEEQLEDAEDDEEIDHLEDALENLDFTEDMEEFNLFIAPDDEDGDDPDLSLLDED